MRVAVRVIVALLLALTPSVSAVAQALSADEKELASYRLTLQTMNKVAAVTRAMAEEMMQDPKVKESMKLVAEIDALEKKDEPTEADEERLQKLRERKEALDDSMENPMSGDANTISEMEAGIRKHQPTIRALQREGLSARDYAKFWLSFLQASMAYGFSQGKLDMSKLPPGINRGNVKFIAEHQQEIEAMQKELAGLGKKK